MKIVKLEAKKNKEDIERKESMIEYLNSLIIRVQNDDIDEFVVCYVEPETEDAGMYSSCRSTLNTVGLLEIAKHIALNI